MENNIITNAINLLPTNDDTKIATSISEGEDSVHHPKHYSGSCSLECIDVMRVIFGSKAVKYFCLCNAFKYMWRYKNKNGSEDLNKAKWYLDYINRKCHFDKVFAEKYTEVVNLYKSITEK